MQTIKNKNILWTDSAEGYRTTIIGYSFYNKNVTDYETTRYARILLGVYKFKWDEISQKLTAFINSEFERYLAPNQIKQKLGKPYFCVESGNKGSIIWNKTKFKNSDNKRVAIICNITEDNTDTITIRSEAAKKKSKLESLKHFLNNTEIKTCK